MFGSPARRLLLAVLTGLLYPLCFPHFDLGLLAWVVLVPLHLAIEALPLRRAFFLGWLTGWVAFIGTMWWVGQFDAAHSLSWRSSIMPAEPACA